MNSFILLNYYLSFILYYKSNPSLPKIVFTSLLFPSLLLVIGNSHYFCVSYLDQYSKARCLLNLFIFPNLNLVLFALSRDFLTVIVFYSYDHSCLSFYSSQDAWIAMTLCLSKVKTFLQSYSIRVLRFWKDYSLLFKTILNNSPCSLIICAVKLALRTIAQFSTVREPEIPSNWSQSEHVYKHCVQDCQ